MSAKLKWRARIIALAVPEFLIQVAIGMWQGACEAYMNIRDAWRKEIP